MRLVVAPAVSERFEDLALAWATVEGLRVGGAGDARARALVDEASERVRASRTLDDLREAPLFRAYRDFYWALGIDPTKTRPAGEALNRRVLNGNALPTINAFVDAYNAASLETGVPLGAYDLALVRGDVALRPARAGEPFHGIGQAEARALAGGELVLADEARVLNFYPYRDADATKVTTATTRALLVACGAPGVGVETLERAAARAAERVVAACGGSVATRGVATRGVAARGS